MAVSGDKNLFPYGQRLIIPALGTPPKSWQRRTGQKWYVVRVVDTGCHFYDDPSVRKCGRHGAVKVVHVDGHEPIDVPVSDPRHGFDRLPVEAAMVPGDVLDPRTGRPVRMVNA